MARRTPHDDDVDWRLEQFFAAGKPGTLNVSTDVTVSRKRNVFFLPTLLVG